MKINYLPLKFKKFFNDIDLYVKPKVGKVTKLLIFIDFLISIVVFGSGINDFLQYQFYKRNYRSRKDFIVFRRRMKIIKTFNNFQDRQLFDDKEKFNVLFEDFIGREWFKVKGSDYAYFKSFTTKIKKFIVKPLEGSHGKGIRIIDITKIDDKKKLYKNMSEENVILEELIDQHNELAQFNPTSVNTLRVVTLLCPDNKVRIMTANFRMGNGKKYADNFHHNGIASLLDVDNGTVVTKGMDREFNQYIFHPYSGIKIIGYQIPYWDKIREKVKEAARLVPTVGYIGWDIAINKEGQIIIIEGNAAADPDISQMPDQIGKWDLYKPFVKQMKEVKNNTFQ